ncbi:MAG TPA: hypothetical protein VK846_19895, partial [Candidatus Limnocylindria bacterium]|nr:hypothetical protein [Candidatus Limnocylindria bacterium]
SNGSTKQVNVIQIGMNNVNAFIGTGDPDSNGDGAFDVTDDPAASGAIGLKINNFSLGLALLKPVLVTDKSSYCALRATVQEIALVGVPGVVLNANMLEVKINGASAPATGGGMPTGPPPPVVNFETSFAATSGLVVQTGPDPDGAGGNPAPSVLLNFTTHVLAASGNVELEFDFDNDSVTEISFSTFISFEQGFRPNGTKIIKIAISDLTLILGDPADPIFELTDISGLILITPQGLAASFTVPFDINVSGGSASLAFSGEVRLEINNTNQLINEEFVVDSDGNTETLSLPKGPFLRIAGHVALVINFSDNSADDRPDFALEGDFAFEQITLRDPDGPGGLPPVTAIRVGMANVNSSVLGVSFSDGAGGFVFLPEGIAGTLRLTTDIEIPGIGAAGGDVVLQINTTNLNVDQTISVGGENIAIKFTAPNEKQFVRFAILNASIEFPPYFKLSGDFTVQNVGDETLYGARNVEIFLGFVPDGGSFRDENGNIKAGAIGLLVTNATIGVIKMNTSTPGVTKFAAYAYGETALIGLDGLTIQGAITVRINNTGVALDRSIELPEDPLAEFPPDNDGADNNGNGLIDEPGETTAVRVKFSSTAKIEEFSAGFDELGEITEGSQVVISAAGIFTLSGAVRFTSSPTGRIDVDLPEASVTISMPDGDGGVQEVFGLTGSARFFFGGAEGFQLQSLQVRGYSIFGVGATIPPATSTLLPVTADLAGPTTGSIVEIGGLQYLYVIFNDVNRVGLNEGSITDDAAEFAITASRPDGTSVTLSASGAGEKVTDANNDRTFRYLLNTDALDLALNSISRVNIQVTFLANSWSDSVGKGNSSEIERFIVYKATAPIVNEPYAMLANPFNGATVNTASLNAKRYIDITFVSPNGGFVDPATIDGNELKLTGPGAANLDKNAAGFLIGSIQKISTTTYRFFVQPKTGVNVAQTFADGEITVQVVAGSWSVGTATNAAITETFTVSSTVQDAAAATNNITLGPLVIEGPSVGLIKTGFKDGQLVLTIGIGANKAGLDFGSAQGSSGVTAEVTGLLGTFDISVDIFAALGAITGGGNIADAFSVPGKFRIDIAGLKVVVPNVVEVTGSGIVINYDPNYDPTKNGGARQEIVVVQSAKVTFPSFGVSGLIVPNGTKPGLVVYEN